MKKKVKLVIEVLLTVLLCANIPCYRVLSISDRKNPSKSFYSRKGINGFAVSYTHSVNKGRIHDFYSIARDGRIKMNRSVFVSYGAGITEPEEIDGCNFILTENGYELTDMNIVQNEFLVAVGAVAEHSICFCSPDSSNRAFENEIFLKDYFPAGTSLKLKVKKLSLIHFFIRGVKQ